MQEINLETDPQNEEIQGVIQLLLMAKDAIFYTHSKTHRVGKVNIPIYMEKTPLQTLKKKLGLITDKYGRTSHAVGDYVVFHFFEDLPWVGDWIVMKYDHIFFGTCSVSCTTVVEEIHRGDEVVGKAKNIGYIVSVLTETDEEVMHLLTDEDFEDILQNLDKVKLI
jgi:hypothetical protein